MTIALLIKLTCPYCDDEEYFKKIQNIQRHCQRKHSILLPSRSRGDQPPKNSTKYTEALHEKYPSILVKLICPCCCDLFVNKSALKTHVDEQHNVFQQNLETRTSDWNIHGVSVVEKFHNFRAHCVQNNSKYVNIDEFFNQILATSSILVLQQRNDYQSIPSEYFSSSLLKEMHRQLLRELNTRKVMNAETSTRIKDTLLAYRNDEIDGLKTRRDLISLAEKSTDPERNVVLAVESLIPVMTDVDLRTISENHLAASYVHPVMQSLFSIACNNKVSHCSNTLPEVDDTTGKRPDYIVDVYERYQYAYSSCFGEIKIEKANDTLKVLDFYRLAIFGRNAIESHNLNGIICFQTIGSLVTFYYMLPRADFFIFLEVTSIKIPLVKRDIVSIITHLDDMLSLVCLHELVENTNELASSYPPILPYVYVQNERKSLPKKRKPSLTSILSSSKH